MDKIAIQREHLSFHNVGCQDYALSSVDGPFSPLFETKADALRESDQPGVRAEELMDNAASDSAYRLANQIRHLASCA